MILNLSKLRVSDNSGVKLVKCFKIFNQKTGSIGSIIYVSIKDIKNKSKLKNRSKLIISSVNIYPT